jgi:hypothetical protein
MDGTPVDLLFRRETKSDDWPGSIARPPRVSTTSAKYHVHLICAKHGDSCHPPTGRFVIAPCIAMGLITQLPLRARECTLDCLSLSHLHRLHAWLLDSY